MFKNLPSSIILAPDVARAIRNHHPVVALETTVLTHGLPKPFNIQLSKDVEDILKLAGVVPATIGVLDGDVHVGMSDEALERLVSLDSPRKISRRDFGIAGAFKESGGTTVAGTLIAARAAGIKVFATGGIGGVHRGGGYDISTDLQELSRQPVIVVSAGVKSILNIQATLEYLETMGVPVIGYQTNEFPAFYSRSSGMPIQVRADSPEQVAEIAEYQWNLGIESAVLVVVPPPEDVALDAELMENAVQQALESADAMEISGQDVTPFLLDQVSQVTGKASLQANLGLLKNNVTVAAEIAKALQRGPKTVSA